MMMGAIFRWHVMYVVIKLSVQLIVCDDWRGWSVICDVVSAREKHKLICHLSLSFNQSDQVYVVVPEIFTG